MQRYIAVILMFALLVGCSGGLPRASIEATAKTSDLATAVSPPRPTPTHEMEGQIEPAQGWESVGTFNGSGMQNFCLKVNIKKPWRLRWRVGETTNAKFGSGNITIEVYDNNTPSKWKKELLKSDYSSVEYTSPVFTNTVNSLCIFARSKYTDYVILLEQKAK